MKNPLTKMHFPAQTILLGRFQDALKDIVGKRILVVGSSRSVALADWSVLFPQAEVTVFSGSLPHTPELVLNQSTVLAKAFKPDIIIGIGSGSAIDLVKGVLDSVPATFIAIPTSLGGGEMTNVYGIRTVSGTKEGKGGRQYLASTVIYDPELLESLPSHELAASGINSWAHCIEAFYSVKSNWFGKSAAMQAGRMWPTLLKQSYGKPLDATIRVQLFEAASLAGFSINACGLGLHHAVCHVVGGATGLTHGVINAIALPKTLAINLELAPQAIRQVEEAFCVDDIVALSQEVIDTLQLPRSLDSLGVSWKTMEPLTDSLMAAHHLKFNPAALDRDRAQRLMHAVFTGSL
ncbi:iron-containing alcohol dehydrogenase family protein [Advenella kashmirensis]